MKKLLLLGILILGYLFSICTPSFAQTTAVFPTCSNQLSSPLIANFSDGVHGIPGDTTTHSGRDQVYLLDNNNALQCFCDTSGNGTQSNWQNASGFTDADIKILENEGWIYIPDGSVWGLSSQPYLVLNSSYACLSGGTGGGTSNNSSQNTNGGSS